MKDRQCSSCGGFCPKSGCERENVERMRFGPNELTFKDATGKVTLYGSTIVGTPEYRIRPSNLPPNSTTITCSDSTTEWARIDKDMNVIFLDMGKCAEGPHNNYTTLAMAIWNAAIEAAAKVCDGLREHVGDNCGEAADAIREMKK